MLRLESQIDTVTNKNMIYVSVDVILICSIQYEKLMVTNTCIEIRKNDKVNFNFSEGLLKFSFSPELRPGSVQFWVLALIQEQKHQARQTNKKHQEKVNPHCCGLAAWWLQTAVMPVPVCDHPALFFPNICYKKYLCKAVNSLQSRQVVRTANGRKEFGLRPSAIGNPQFLHYHYNLN